MPDEPLEPPAVGMPPPELPRELDWPPEEPPEEPLEPPDDPDEPPLLELGLDGIEDEEDC